MMAFINTPYVRIVEPFAKRNSSITGSPVCIAANKYVSVIRVLIHKSLKNGKYGIAGLGIKSPFFSGNSQYTIKTKHINSYIIPIVSVRIKQIIRCYVYQ